MIRQGNAQLLSDATGCRFTTSAGVSVLDVGLNEKGSPDRSGGILSG